jgi:hypothetical protein
VVGHKNCTEHKEAVAVAGVATGVLARQEDAFVVVATGVLARQEDASVVVATGVLARQEDAFVVATGVLARMVFVAFVEAPDLQWDAVVADQLIAPLVVWRTDLLGKDCPIARQVVPVALLLDSAPRDVVEVVPVALPLVSAPRAAEVVAVAAD